MDIILIIVVLLIPIPLYAIFHLLYVKEKNRHGNAAVQRSFKELIKRNRLTISEVNKFVNRLIAIDRNSGTVIVVVHNDGNTWQKCIGLEEIRNCEIISTRHPQNGFIQKVTMELSLCNSQENMSFAFFDDKIEDVRDLGRRMKQARYWQKKIQYYLIDAPGFAHPGHAS
jgi:hypothetical protein